MSYGLLDAPEGVITTCGAANALNFATIRPECFQTYGANANRDGADQVISIQIEQLQSIQVFQLCWNGTGQHIVKKGQAGQLGQQPNLGWDAPSQNVGSKLEHFERSEQTNLSWDSGRQSIVKQGQMRELCQQTQLW